MNKVKSLFQVKRFLAMFLAIVLTVPTMPISAYAAPENVVTSETIETETASAEVLDITPMAEEGNEETTVVYAIADQISEEAKVKVYTGSAVFDLNDSQYTQGIVITKDDEVYSSVFDVAGYSYKWQTEVDGTYTDMAADAVPVNAGKYRLVVSVPEVADTYAAMSKEIDFEITKASLSISWGFVAPKPGTKVGDVTLSNFEASDPAGNMFRYIADDASTTDVDESAESQLNYTIKIKDTFTGTEYPADSIINNKTDYVIEVIPSFTDKVSAEVQPNYEALPTVSDDLTVSSLVSTRINLTLGEKWTEAGVVSRDYNGSAVVLDETDYTAVVQYENGTDENGNTVYTDIADAEIEVTWMDANHNVLEGAPVDAGTYYCALSYAGKTGIYDACTSSTITVIVNRASITIRPYIVGDASFFVGTSVYEVLQNVDYDVYDASDKKMDIDRSTFWGNYIDYDEVTFPYEPVFEVQESYDTGATDENGNPIIEYYSIYDDDKLQKDKTYRVIFSGYKAVYEDDDSNYNYIDINSISDYGSVFLNQNHTVDVNFTTLEKHTVAVKVAEGTLATISADAIFVGEAKAGNSYDNPITKEYDTKDIYEKRAEYKKAVVTPADATTPIAQNTDKALTYTWYHQDGTTSKWNQETQQYEEVPYWVSTSYYNSPSDVGNYRLEISYEHEDGKYVAEPVYVYYRIDKQKVKVVPTGEYTAYTETSISDFVDNTDFTYDIYTVPAEGEEAKKLNWNDWTHYIYWTVERQTDAENDTWVNAYGESFEKDNVYRLVVDELEFYSSSLSNNYVNYEVVTEGEGENATTKDVYLNETKDINLKVMGATELEVVVSEPIAKEKVYDGTYIDLSEEIANGKIKLVTKVDQKEVTDVSVTALWYDVAYDEFLEYPVDAGTYEYYVFFEGDETYHSLTTKVEGVSATIAPAEVTVTPSVKEEVVAGQAVPYVVEKTEFDGVAEVDQDAFAYKIRYDEDTHSYYYAWDAFGSADLVLSVTDKDGNAVTSNIYEGNKKYNVTAELVGSYYPYSRNYTFKSNTVSFETVRGNSTVTASNMFGGAFIVSDVIDGMNHTIKPEEGVPYFSGMIDDGFTDGNYVIIEITKPDEYTSIPAEAIYKNQIEAAGGYICYTNETTIAALFNASLYDKKEFSIRWEEDYTENFTVDFSEASLLDNLNEAQAPKSLSFVSPVKKMTVGDGQQLNVKLTKVLESDIISLKYESSNEDVLCVDEDGYVTALATGTAMVTVSSVREVNGEIVDTDPVKKATVSITVSDVTAPKITKVTAWDVDVELMFTAPGNGYRSEIYILEGKNKTADDFEKAIASMKNQKWEGIFVVAPEYEEWDYINNSDYFYGLEPNTDYTVYVRNVSLLSDECYGNNHDHYITESVAGAVKSFKTTKMQVRELELGFNDGKTKYDYDADKYTVKLSDKNTSVSVWGWFADADTAADYDDYVKFSLPLTKEQQKDYFNPKLKYYIGTRSATRTKDTIYAADGFYVNKTSIASISGKGKISLKGAGEVVVVAYDTVSMYYAYTTLKITASADNIAGKNTKLTLGQSVELSDLLIYKDGKKAIKGVIDTHVIVDDAVKKAFEDSEYFDLYDTTVVAVKSGGSLTVTLSDAYVGKDKTAEVTLQSVVLDPVKKLKTSFVTDQFADIEFTHSGYAKAFRIRVTDGRGDLMEDIQVAANSLYDYSKGKYSYRITGLTQKSKYTVTVTAVYGDESLKEESKAVKKSFKTTAIPASYVSLTNNQYNTGVNIVIYKNNGANSLQYASIVAGNKYTLNLTNDYGNLNLGAKYAQTDTLTWTSSNKKVATVKANKDSFTATLNAVKSGWTVIEVKSKITKAVIARYEVYIYAVGNADSYYGSNEPLPTNEVTTPDYGKPDYSRGELGVEDTRFAKVMLGVTYDVSLDENEYKWYSFTAPTTGTYRFKASEGMDSDIWIFTDINAINEVYEGATFSELCDRCAERNDGDSSTGWSFNTTCNMTTGETIYFAVGDYNLNDPINFTFTVTME